jgi:hypothetical protein
MDNSRIELLLNLFGIENLLRSTDSYNK